MLLTIGGSNALAQGDGPTITVDPAAVEGISIDDGPGSNVAEPPGPIGRAINDLVPPRPGTRRWTARPASSPEPSADLVDGFSASLPQLVIGTLVLFVTFLLAELARKLVTSFAERAKLRPNLVDLFGIMSRIAVWFAGFMIAASIVFPGFGPGQLIATAGLASIAIGFAFQDIFENFFAGILILLNFPFHAGDFIEVDGLTGKVEDITIRMTKLRQTSGELLLIPNATIFKGNVNVLTNKPKRRIELAVGIAYGEDVAKGRQCHPGRREGVRHRRSVGGVPGGARVGIRRVFDRFRHHLVDQKLSHRDPPQPRPSDRGREEGARRRGHRDPVSLPHADLQPQ